MVKYVVIGDPVAHSRSPGMQNAAFEYYHMGSPYGRMLVHAAEFEKFVDFARTNLDGFNLTVPHKAMILPYLDEITPQAQAAASVNTVTVKNGRFSGTSTDGYGLEQALRRAFNRPLEGADFCFIGCGGAAHATAFHLAGLGVSTIRLANRTLEKAEELAEKLRAFRPGLIVETTRPDDRGTLQKWFTQTDFLIQATSLGLHDEDPAPFDLSLLTPRHKLCIFDTIYRSTKLQRHAAELGLPCADGMWMLIYQGARSFEIWTGKDAPVEVMHKGFQEAPTCK